MGNHSIRRRLFAARITAVYSRIFRYPGAHAVRRFRLPGRSFRLRAPVRLRRKAERIVVWWAITLFTVALFTGAMMATGGWATGGWWKGPAALFAAVANARDLGFPSVVGWVEWDNHTQRVVLGEAIPLLREVGPEPTRRLSLWEQMRRVAFWITRWDPGDPRAVLAAAVGHAPPGGTSNIMSTSARSTDIGQMNGATFADVRSPDRQANLGENSPGTDSQRAVSDPSKSAASVDPDGLGKPQAAQAGDPAATARVRWGSQPLIAIYHTHTSEMYTTDDFKPAKASQYHLTNTTRTGVVEVGEVLAKRLQGEYGIPVIHVKTLHDSASFTRAYVESEKTVMGLLEKYPSLQIILDIHRDALDSSYAPTAVVKGQKVAQISAVIGLGQSSSPHDWRKNYRFAEQIQERFERMYPGVFQKIITQQDRRYHQQRNPHLLLLEIGAHENRIEEARRSAVLLADVLADLLSDMMPNRATQTPTPDQRVPSDPGSSGLRRP